MGMKKNKYDAINSYASYKANKKKILWSFLIICVGVVILGVAELRGQIQKDYRAFLSTNGISLFSMQRMKPSDNIVLAKGKISYELYTAPIESKGIYIPSKKIKQIEEYISMARETGINSFVIDIKDDNGNLTFKTDNETLAPIGVVKDKPPISNIDQLIQRLNEVGIYPIARIVVFKDNVYTKRYPESAIKGADGTTYVTRSGDRWLDPYNRENWDYILEICDEAYRHGFKEIQFDYVRFHESMNEKTVLIKNDQSKEQIITEFVKYASSKLHEKNIKVSADVFGAVILSDIDAKIVGQDFVEMSKYLDYISPMVYPSHYADGTFGIEYPNLQPYDMILKTMNLGVEKMSCGKEKMAKIRPWLQDFTLSKEPYLLYGPDEIKAQIQGVNDAGLSDWLFWNAAGNYTEEGLMGQ